MGRSDKYIKIVKRPIGGGENTVHYVTRASVRRLQDQVKRVYKKQIPVSLTPLKDLMSDEDYRQWRADTEQNLIDGSNNRNG